MFLLLFIIVLAILIRIATHLFARKGTRTIKFVGPRGAGKTRTLNALIGINGKTVPTLETYKVMYKDVVIHDVVQKDGDFCKRYGIDDPSAAYFFFLRNSDDLSKLQDLRGFDIKLVSCGPHDQEKTLGKNVIFLDEDLTQIEKHFL
ncbi:hypothetical protein KMI_14g19450 [Encephalitozoon hellem]|nr:hypothetical protein KMI_14g19450 [Encephalitozoon hellem]